eukprot:gene11948-15993_t
MTSPWVKATGLLGVSAVALGAIGAHAILKKTPEMRDIWKTGNLYHLVHTVAVGFCATNFAGRKRNLACGLFTAGILLFSGSMYVIVLLEQKKPFSYLAPFGGIMLMAGWVVVGFF